MPDYPDHIAIQPIGPFAATIRPPGSKSLTNRALLLAALAEGESSLTGVLCADDTARMVAALRGLGVAPVAGSDPTGLRVAGCGGRWPATRASLHLGNAGTAYRFLTAGCCLGVHESTYVLDGVERMRQRPIGQLVDALRRLGAVIDHAGREGYPPLCVHGGGLRGGAIDLQPTLSSQYISALLQVGPLCREGLTIDFEGPITSRPYVEMTLGLMRRFGVTAQVDPAFTRIHVPPCGYGPADYDVEPDASSASYFLAAAAAVPGSQCTIQGLGRASLQGDVGFADVLHQLGAGLVFGSDFITVMSPASEQRLHGIDIDLNHMPDMALTLAAIAPLADGPTRLRNVGNLRVKETDRLAALRTEVRKFGAAADIDGDDLCIAPPAGGRLTPPPLGIDTYDDHRMAMSFAVLGLVVPGVVINHPACVAKTFPEFFEYLGKLR